MQKIIVVAGPVIVENNKVLLNNHGAEDLWKFCGGQIEDRDTNLQTSARREAREEMGIELDITDEEPYLLYVRRNGLDIILAHFLAKRIGEIRPGQDIAEWQWFDLNKLPENIAPNIIPVLKHYKFLK